MAKIKRKNKTKQTYQMLPVQGIKGQSINQKVRTYWDRNTVIRGNQLIKRYAHIETEWGKPLTHKWFNFRITTKHKELYIFTQWYCDLGWLIELTSRLPVTSCIVDSAALYIMVVKFINTIWPPPPQLSLHRRAALLSNSNGTRSYIAERTQNAVYIVRCLCYGVVLPPIS
jgi:hypothetical protein